MIKLYKAERMPFTPFDLEKTLIFLEQQGVNLVDNEDECDILIAERLSPLVNRARALDRKTRQQKKYLIWTREPRANTFFSSLVKGHWKIRGLWKMPDIHVMNVYTGDVFVDNYYENSYIRIIDRWLEPITTIDLSNRKVAALMTARLSRRANSLIKDGKELDLNYIRTQIALEMYQLGKIDIYGRGWPNEMSQEDSRFKNRRERKEKILSNYHFNLCFENTTFDYYCTEKIWESIKFGCLPIYYGEGNKIYEDFPPNSFLDYCNFQNVQDLCQYIENMDEEEFIFRMNLCIDTFNKAYQKYGDADRIDNNDYIINPGMLNRIVKKLQQIMEN